MTFRFFSEKRLIVLAPATLFLMVLSCGRSERDLRGTVDHVLDLAIASRDSQTIEFPRLYDELFDAVPDDENEKLILVGKLKQRGFTISDYGRGNYPPLGPRIIAVTMIKDRCQCEVGKIYYATISDSAWMASERIRCITRVEGETQ